MTTGPGAGMTVRVAAPPLPAHAYDVVVRAGALDDLPALVAAAAPAARYAVIAPDDVATLYGGRVHASLRAAGLDAALIEFAAGEAHKTRQSWAALTDRLLEARFGRDTCVIALGGGVAGDLAGFVAATYMRGVPVVQVPTTLLAMIDAAVGGKTGVDTPAGKNLVGAFHAPALVVADPVVLGTLPPLQVRSGLAEAIKHGAILDAAYFDWIDAHVADILALDADVLAHLVGRSVELKAAVVMEDPHEHGRRAVLNFGHTIGHALERRSDYTLPHGLAVAMGMVAEAALGEACGVTESGTRERLHRMLRRAGLPTAPDAAPVDELVAAMQLDKKARRARPRFTLLHRIGACARDASGGWTHEVQKTVLAGVIRQPIHDSDAV